MTNYHYERAYAWATLHGLEMPEAGDFAHEYEWATEASPTPIGLADYWQRWTGKPLSMEARDAYAHLLNAHDQLDKAMDRSYVHEDAGSAVVLIRKAQANISKVMQALAEEIAAKAKPRETRTVSTDFGDETFYIP